MAKSEDEPIAQVQQTPLGYDDDHLDLGRGHFGTYFDKWLQQGEYYIKEKHDDDDLHTG
jgi:hypothetical protein